MPITVGHREQKLILAKRGQSRAHVQGHSFATAMDQLTLEEPCVCEWRRLGCSSRQSARHEWNSAAAVEALYSQATATAKIRGLLN
jgi:hypothetical protein